MLLIVLFIWVFLYKDENGVQAHEKINYRIINGVIGDIKEFPYQVSIMFRGQHHCGGSIIAERFILTAAHCTYEIPPQDLTVRVGSSTINKGGKIYAIENSYVHPNFTPRYEYDISVLKIKTALKFNKKAKPVALPPQDAPLPPDGTLALVSGWGRTIETKDMMSPNLLYIEIPLIPKWRCMSFYASPKYIIDKRMFCAGNLEEGKDSCHGDSGGALVIDGIQYGIVSWGVGCGNKNRPGVYASVAELRYFITQHAGV